MPQANSTLPSRRWARLWTNVNNLARSSTFRLSVLYTAVFGLSAVAILGFVYGRTLVTIDAEVDQTINAEMLTLTQDFTELGLNGLTDAVEDRMDPERSGDNVYLVTDPQMQIRSGNLPEWPSATPDSNDWVAFDVQRDWDDTPHSVRAKVAVLPGDIHLLVGRDLRAHTDFQSVMTDAIVSAVLISLLLGVGGGLLTARAMLSRIDTIRVGADRIILGDMAHRMPVRGTGDEFDRLTLTLNSMLDEIERLMTAMRTVTNDIAHDLRSPLTRVKSRLELALMSGPEPGAQREAILLAIAEADRMIGTFNALLSIASAEAGAIQASLEPVALGELATDVVELYGPIAEESQVTMALEIAGRVAVNGNRQLLLQALTNLVDNALKYAAEGGSITVATRLEGETAVLSVADRGRGIAPQDRDRVLERFVRLDASRSTQGNGLGLSLVAAITRQHRGRLTLADNQPGLRVELRLPALADRALAA